MGDVRGGRRKSKEMIDYRWEWAEGRQGCRVREGIGHDQGIIR